MHLIWQKGLLELATWWCLFAGHHWGGLTKKVVGDVTNRHKWIRWKVRMPTWRCRWTQTTRKCQIFCQNQSGMNCIWHRQNCKFERDYENPVIVIVISPKTNMLWYIFVVHWLKCVFEWKWNKSESRREWMNTNVNLLYRLIPSWLPLDAISAAVDLKSHMTDHHPSFDLTTWPKPARVADVRSLIRRKP